MKINESQIVSSWENKYSGPLVTVACTVYNHLQYIRKTLESLLSQQTDFPYEIIVHDDASTDGTTDIIKEYAEAYPHIIIPVIQTENQYSKGNWGHPKTINPLIRGKYVALCEGDDYWTDPYKLEKQISYMESHSDCTMTFHAVNYVHNGKVIRNDRRSETETDFTVQEIILGGGAFCATSSLCCRTDAYIQYPRFRKMAKIGDYPQQILMGLLGHVHYFPEIMGVYRFMEQGSWTLEAYKYQGSVELYKLLVNQICWMAELNCYTDYKYDEQISAQIETIMQEELMTRNQEISRLQSVYKSASWRIGNFLIQPVHALKVIIEKLRKH